MNTIVEMKFGSHLYGTDTPESDQDFKGIYIPTSREIVLHTYKSTISTSRTKADCERNTKDDVDKELFSLDRYLGLLMEGQTVALDMLFAPVNFWTNYNIEGSYIMSELFRNRKRLITRNIMAFVGYARQQASKYGIKGSRMDALQRTIAFLEPLSLYSRLGDHNERIMALIDECASFISLEKTPLVTLVHIQNPNGKFEPYLEVCGRKMAFTATVKVAKECFGKILAEYGARAKKAHLDGGVDWKALSHAVRVNSEAQELLLTGTITFPRPDRGLLLAIKKGLLPYEKVAECIELGLANLYKAHELSLLPDVPDKAWADQFIYNTYCRYINYGDEK